MIDIFRYLKLTFHHFNSFHFILKHYLVVLISTSWTVQIYESRFL